MVSLEGSIFSTSHFCSSPLPTGTIVTPTEEVAARASREHIMAAINGALEKFGDQPQRTARVITGVKPHYTSKPVSKHQAQKKMEKIIGKMF